jgi:hypothetical protein
MGIPNGLDLQRDDADWAEKGGFFGMIKDEIPLNYRHKS